MSGFKSTNDIGPIDTPEKIAYYREGFVLLMRVVNAQALVICALSVGLAFFLFTYKARDRYFAETAMEAKMQMVSLPSPNMGRDAVMNWAAQAVSQIMTFGFNDIDEKFAISRLNFTEDGWNSFSKAVINSRLIEAMTKSQQILATVPYDTPVLKKEGMVEGSYTWEVDVPVLVTFRAGGVKSMRKKVVNVVIKQVPTRESPSGMGINQWNMY